MADFTEDEIKKLGEQVRSLSTAVQKEAKAKSLNREAEAKLFRDKLRESRQAISEAKISKELRKKLNNQLDDQVDSYNDLKKAQDRQRKAIQGVTSALGGLYGAAEKGEGTISSFTGIFKGRGVIGDAFSSLGTRLDTNIETFRQLSQTGANFGQSIVSMREAAGTALLPLDDFASLVAQNSQNLAALFGSTTRGARGIAQLSEGMRKVGVESLAPLGFTVEEINDTLLLNLERQRRTFNFDANSRTQNIQSAINLAKQLDRLAKLTGTQRDELQKQIEQQMSNERFQAFLGSQTRETGQRLENFAATIGSLAPGLTEGFEDLIANSGRPVTEAAIALIQNMPEAQAAIQNLIAGTTSSEQALMSIRNAAIKSQDRFRMATVTGTVEFLRLQGGVIKLATTNMNLNSVLAEQAALSPKLTKGLTEFQDAAKRLSGQFQKIETGLLAGFGPALGGISQFTQGGMKALGGIAAKIAEVPVLSGTLLLAGLTGKYLFDRGSQIAIIAAGTAIGTGKGLGGLIKGIGGKGAVGKAQGSFAGSLGGFGKGGPGIGSKMLRTGGGIGAALGGAMAIGDLTKDKTDLGAWGTLAGTGIGALFGGPLGMMLGGMAGGALGNLIGGKQHGGPMTGGNPHLVGEAGPEIVMTKTNANVLSNADSKKMFNTEAMEKGILQVVTAVSPVAKILHEVNKSLNTGNMIQNKTRIASETTARKGNTVGMVGG